jgi:hypothetical protein
MPDELKQQFDKLTYQDKILLVKMVSSIGSVEDEEKAQQLLDTLPEPVREVFFGFIGHKLKEEILEKQKRDLKEKSLPIKKDTIEILKCLLASCPPKSKEEEKDLIDRAIRIAQALNDHF